MKEEEERPKAVRKRVTRRKETMEGLVVELDALGSVLGLSQHDLSHGRGPSTETKRNNTIKYFIQSINGFTVHLSHLYPDRQIRLCYERLVNPTLRRQTKGI